MKNCINCGYSLELNAKFCPECGSKQPENNPENQASPLVGDKNVISTGGGDITGTKITGGNVSYTNVHHAQDDTKKRVRCFYTGQGVALEDLLNCPSCKKDVARSYYNFNNKRCYHCDDTAKNEYTLLMRGYLSDGRLDPTEIKELQMHQIRLLLTDDETKIIERSERERLAFVKTSNISDKELRDIEDLANLFELNKHIKQGDSIINVLYKKYPQSPEVSFYYFLNEFEKKDSKLYDIALSSREDNLFAYYFGGIAAELEGKTDESQKIIEKLSLVYEEYFYLNDALKLLSLAEKFEYQPNKLISDKVIALINEIETSSIKGIYLSAYLGLIGYVDNYCCNAANAAAIAKNSDSTSAALGYFFINIREQKLLAEKRKLEAQKQAEQERIELEKLEKKKAEEKAQAEALRIERERKEKEEEKNRLEREKQLELKKEEDKARKEKREKQFDTFIKWFTKKDDKGTSPLHYTLLLLMFIIVVVIPFIFIVNKDNKDNEISFGLEKKAEMINILVLKGEIDSARVLLQDLVHPSDASSSYEKEGFMQGTYRYNEYWQMKREELRDKIQEYNKTLAPMLEIKNRIKAGTNVKGQSFYFNNILFEKNSDELQNESEMYLRELLSFMTENSKVTLLIIGHSSSDGDDNNNLKLSRSRAKSVSDYLINNGLSPKRLSVDGKGARSPIASNSTEEGRKLNRRIEFVITDDGL